MLLLCGTVNTLANKWQYQVESVDVNGNTKYFRKPWFGSFIMFCAMSLVLLLYPLQRCCSGKKTGNDASAPLLSKPRSALTIRTVLLIGIPASSDLIATGLNRIGLLTTSASLWQMLRGAIIVFSAILSRYILGKSLSRMQWVGVGLAVFGILCVGTAGILNSEVSVTAADATGLQVATGIGFVLLGQLVQAAQTVIEQKLLTDVDVAPTLFVGIEGIWGVLLMSVLVFPLLLHLPGSDVGGSEENIFDTEVGSRPVRSVGVSLH